MCLLIKTPLLAGVSLCCLSQTSEHDIRTLHPVELFFLSHYPNHTCALGITVPECSISGRFFRFACPTARLSLNCTCT